jgi:hypothetical protein
VTRAAVREGFERFVDRAIAEAADAFSIARALRRGGHGGAVVDRLLSHSDRLHSRVVRPELDAYRRRILAQFDVLSEYIASGEGIERFRDRLLATDIYARCLRSDLPAGERERIRDALVERQRRFAGAIEPLVAAEADSFWAAVTGTLSREEAVVVVEEQFAFTGPLRRDRGAFRMVVEIDPGEVIGGGLGAVLGRLPRIEVEYTDEALRAMSVAEETVIAETKAELDRRY